MEAYGNTRVLIYSELSGPARQEARQILADAEEMTGGVAPNAVTHFESSTGRVTVVFRNREVLRAEALEETRHVWQFRQGGHFLAAGASDVASVLRAFQTREFEATVHLRDLFRQGQINVHEYHDTVRNTAGYFDMSFQDMLRHVEAFQ